jgi:DNA methylase
MRKTGSRSTELEPGCSNRSSLDRVELKALTTRTGDPWRCKSGEVKLAVAVLERLPDGAPCPIIVNAAGQVLVGHIFLEAARKLKLTHVVVVRHEGLTELEEKHYSVAINQLLGKGGWEPAALEQWVREFEAGIQDFSHLLIGFENGELDKLLGIPGKITGGSGDELPPLTSTAVSKAGMLWKLNQHYVLVGDATDSGHLARVMAGAAGKLALTDPPFGCKVDGFVSKKGLHRDFVQGAGELSPAELHQLFLGFARNLAAVLAKGSLVYIFIDWRSLHVLLRACEEVFGPLIQFCCWVKDRAGMGGLYRSQHELVLVFRVPGAAHANNVQLGRHGRNRSNVWDYPSAASSRNGREGDMLKLHPTPKTVEMIADAILDSTEHGDHIVDCFLGSGTSLIAAERTGRICHGMDLDPLYVDVAIRRWQTWTGGQAIEVESGRTFDDLAEAQGSGEEVHHG